MSRVGSDFGIDGVINRPNWTSLDENTGMRIEKLVDVPVVSQSRSDCCTETAVAGTVASFSSCCLNQTIPEWPECSVQLSHGNFGNTINQADKCNLQAGCMFAIAGSFFWKGAQEFRKWFYRKFPKAIRYCNRVSSSHSRFLGDPVNVEPFLVSVKPGGDKKHSAVKLFNLATKKAALPSRI